MTRTRPADQPTTQAGAAFAVLAAVAWLALRVYAYAATTGAPATGAQATAVVLTAGAVLALWVAHQVGESDTRKRPRYAGYRLVVTT